MDPSNSLDGSFFRPQHWDVQQDRAVGYPEAGFAPQAPPGSVLGAPPAGGPPSSSLRLLPSDPARSAADPQALPFPATGPRSASGSAFDAHMQWMVPEPSTSGGQVRENGCEAARSWKFNELFALPSVYHNAGSRTQSFSPIHLRFPWSIIVDCILWRPMVYRG
jgi:hypothetical protein